MEVRSLYSLLGKPTFQNASFSFSVFKGSPSRAGSDKIRSVGLSDFTTSAFPALALDGNSLSRASDSRACAGRKVRLPFAGHTVVCKPDNCSAWLHPGRPVLHGANRTMAVQCRRQCTPRRSGYGKVPLANGEVVIARASNPLLGLIPRRRRQNTRQGKRQTSTIVFRGYYSKWPIWIDIAGFNMTASGLLDQGCTA